MKTNNDLSTSNKVPLEPNLILFQENSATRIWIDKMASPGPGQYEPGPLNHFYETPSTKFGNENRFSGSKKEKIPGPGTYTFENLDAVREHAPKYVFGSSQRGDSRDKERTQTPGPGAYKHPKFMGYEGQSKTMGLKPSYESLQKERA